MTGIPKISALMPMKDHSERVPGKNYRLIAGRPLFAWVLQALSRSKYISKVYIDTDSPRLADMIRKDFDAAIIERPKELCGDFTPMTDILAHDVSKIPGEWFLQTHSTNPLLTPDTIDAAVERLFAEPGMDSLFTVTPWRKRFYDAKGHAVNHDPAVLLRTQDLPPLYEENSCLYIFNRRCIETLRRRFSSDRSVMFEMRPEESLDIDTELDFTITEALLKKRTP